MITPNKIKKSQALHIIKLIEEFAKLEIMARLGPYQAKEYGCLFLKSIKKKDELLEYIFGTSNSLVLGYRWGVLKKKTKKRKKKR